MLIMMMMMMMMLMLCYFINMVSFLSILIAGSQGTHVRL